VSINKILDILVENCGDPSIACCIKLDSFFIFAFNCSNFDLLAREWAIDLIGCGLLYGSRDECAFRMRDESERIVKEMRGVVG